MKKLLMLAAIFTAVNAYSQPLTQTIRGTIVDEVTRLPLIGANVIIPGSDPLLGAATDIDGNFRIANVPVGKYTIKVTFMGYKEMILPNVIVNSGKEVVLPVSLKENFIEGKEVIIKPSDERSQALNETAVVSARSFSVEETQKFAAAVNDPARMASSFAGVVSTDDGNNNISIRGNSPMGLKWRMEGVDIPNPNHFAAPGSSGGGISILSAQVMSTSDFLTGAFPAEYGNALSGVFDIRLRKGNNEKAEYTLQAGFLGLDAAAEGPFSKNYKGSYLVNYRYSTLSILGKMGVNVGKGTTDFQDISYNIFIPAGKFGNFSLFGFGGLSSQVFDAPKDSIKWKEDGERYNSDFTANTGAAGFTHSVTLGKETWLKSSLVYSATNNIFSAYRLDDYYKPQERFNESTLHNKLGISSVINHKINSRHHLRGGITLNRIYFDINNKTYNQDVNAVLQTIKINDNTDEAGLFLQSSYYISQSFLLNTGLHYSHFLRNSSYSIEPRASLSYDISESKKIGIGYGLHSQFQPVGIYFATTDDGRQPNQNLDMSKAHHFVASFDQMLNNGLHIKAEAYYQSLFDIPVRGDKSNSFSMVNLTEGYITDPLVNKGTGMNYGLELTAEKYLDKSFYFLVSGSLYESKYRGSDNVLRDSRFNGNYALTVTAGKEIVTGKKFKNRVIGFNIKTIYRGGFRDTPLDLAASEALPGEGAVYHEELAYTVKYPAYFRTDIRVSVKRNRPSSTQTLALDIQNVSNHQNIYGKFYNPETNSIKTYYQTSLIPVLSYKIEF